MKDILETIDQKYWDEAKRRFEIIKPFIDKKSTKEEIIQHSENCKVHYTTIYRWLKAYENSRELVSLIPKYSNRGGKGEKRLEVATELIIDKAINDLYLYKQKFTARQVYSEIKRRCKHSDIAPPHENTVRNRIKQLEDKKVIQMREGRRAADRLYKNTDGMFPEGTYPLDVIQIDHTPMDIIIVDEKYRQPIGRPYLTLAMDVYSRMITGYYIAIEEPSYFSVSQCLTNSILTKEKFLRDHDVEGEWKICGIPRALHLDNAAEFKSENLQRVCDNHNISLEFRTIGGARYGGHIERIIGTSMRQIHTLPGATFSDIVQKGDYNSEKEAAFTLEELERWMCQYIVNTYHKLFHHGIGMTPDKKYEIGIFGDEHNLGKGLPELIKDEEKFRISLLPTEMRTIQQSGVKIDTIQYYHDVLRKYIRSKGSDGKAQRFLFKKDPRDISTIWFYDSSLKEYFPIPYKNISFPPISQWELREVKRYLSDKYNNEADENQIFIAYEKMHQIKENAIKQTKLMRKKASAKKALTRKKNNDFPNKGTINQKIETAKDDIYDELFNNVEAFDDIDIGLNDEN